MGLREDLVKMLILEIGCNNKQYRSGFTLIELLVVLIIIGITATLITVNFNSLNSIEKQSNSFQRTVNFLTEESIITGNEIGLYLSSNKQFAEYLTDDNKNKIDSNYKNAFWSETSSLRKTFKFEDGSIIELNDQMLELPMMIFYPSGENSGGQIDIYHSNYIQRLVIFSNGKITDEIISY